MGTLPRGSYPAGIFSSTIAARSRRAFGGVVARPLPYFGVPASVLWIPALTPPTQNSTGCRLGDGTESALSRVELLHRALEISRREVRPAAIGEVQLGVGALPEKEIAQALLTAGANKKI